MTLSVEEQRAAYADGLRRYDEARKNGRQRMFHADEEKQRRYNGEANVAEALVRDRLGLDSATPLLEPDAGVGDVVGGWEVKWTERDDGRLLVRPGDSPALNYVLVTGCAPNQIIRGWLPGSEVMVDRHWQKAPPPPAWFVPQSELRAL